ncbi:MAG: glucosamine-6-phosphate deaminase [Deltaproteobacteria bacterium]|nr:glucosamine-6-phosphate deaminase [Deltaproteobacteria bacterium]
MEIIIQENAERAARMTAKLIADAVREKPTLVLGLATGGTMEKVYEFLAEFHAKDSLDFSRVVTFNLDEYVGLPAEDPRSYRYYMEEHLFRHVNIKPENTHLPDGTASDLKSECQRYEELIKSSGGVDLQLLGVGRSGHIGFNEPLSALRSRTRATTLSPVTIEQNQIYFGESAMPSRAITVGVGTILESRRCLMLALGKQKAAVVAKALEGPISSMISASALQLHPHCTVIVDEEAAADLKEKEYYRLIFKTEPDWEAYR